MDIPKGVKEEIEKGTLELSIDDKGEESIINVETKEVLTEEELAKYKDTKVNDDGIEKVEPNPNDNLEDAEAEKQKRIASFYYTNLKDNGLLPSGLEINSLEDLNKAVKEAKEGAVNSFLEDLPEETKKAVEAYKQGIDYSKIAPHDKKIVEYSKITEDSLKEDKELVKKLVKDTLELDGDDEDYIKERLSLMDDSDTYFIEGKRALRILKEKEEKEKKAKENSELEEQKRIDKQVTEYTERIEATVNDKDKLWGIEPTDAEKAKVKLALLNPQEFAKKHKDIIPFEELTKDPEVWTQIYLLYVKGAFGKKGNLDFIKKKGKNEAFDDIDSIIGKGGGAFVENAGIEAGDTGLSQMDSIRNSLRPR